jgi:hypothetical protein
MKNLSLRAMMTGRDMSAVEITTFSSLYMRFPFNFFLLLFLRRAVNKGSLSEVFGVQRHENK